MKSKDRLILIKILKYIDEIRAFKDGYSHEEFENDKKQFIWFILLW